MVLSGRLLEKAQRELGESDETKFEQLKVFREWIENHKFFRKVRSGGKQKLNSNIFCVNLTTHRDVVFDFR